MADGVIVKSSIHQPPCIYIISVTAFLWEELRLFFWRSREYLYEVFKCRSNNSRYTSWLYILIYCFLFMFLSMYITFNLHLLRIWFGTHTFS